MVEPERSRVAVVVVAAGSGARLRAGTPKAFVQIEGRTILERAVATVFELTEPVQLIVVAPEGMTIDARRIVERVAGAASDHVTVVRGADTRQGSVARGLAAVAAGTEVVLVHDAARAFTPVALFSAVIAGVDRTGGGVVPGLPVADTLKRVDAAGTVHGTVDRAELAAVQTPQGFPAEELIAAYAAATADHTDDAALFAAAGRSVTVIEGDPLAFKITTPWDLRRAEDLVRPQSAGGIRTGIGIDVHAFDEGSPLWLGGLYWPDEPGLDGHSDGDAVSHALCDALLSAAGLGDIGGRFGTSEERFRDARGEVFIRETVALVTGAGFSIGNVAVQIIANRPRLAGRRVDIEAQLTLAVGAPVSVSATTSDGLGFTGRGEGLTAIATALLHY